MPPLTSYAPRRYWRSNLLLTATVLAIWFGISFVAAFYADELNQLSIFGFPLGFYIFAQGSVLIYLALILAHVFLMGWLDRRYGVAEDPQNDRESQF